MNVQAGRTIVTGARVRLFARLSSNLDIVHALVRREVGSRFSGNPIGYAWTYVTPLAWIAATYLCFLLFGRIPPVYTDTITFIISGLIPYAAFRYVVGAIGRTNSLVRGLLIYPSVRHEHSIAAAALTELANSAVIVMFVYLCNRIIFGNGELDDPLLFTFGMLLAWALGASYAYLFAALSSHNPSFNQVGQVILRPTFFLSGVFFTANELPATFYAVLGWNPLLHAVDIARDGMLLHYEARVTSSLYVLAWVAAMMAAGLTVSRRRRA